MDYSSGLDEIDRALAPYDNGSNGSSAPPPGASSPPASATAAPVAGSYSISLDDPQPTPGVRFATPKDQTIPSYQAGVDAIDAALAAASKTDAGAPTSPPEATTPPKPTVGDIPSDILTQTAAGIDRGALSMLGLPGEVQNSWNKIWDRAALGVVHKGFDWTGYGPQAGTPERADFDKDWNDINQVGSAVAGPQNLPTGRDIMHGVDAVAGPVPDPKTLPGQYARTFGEFIPGAGRNVVTGALLPAAASETAGQLVKGTGFEPYARAAGAFAGAGVGAAVPAAAKPIASYFEPLTSGGQDAIAARNLAKETSDVPAARAALDQPTEIVPGSVPTTYQQTGDLGQGQFERKLRMNSETAPQFIDRDRAQNAARVDAMENLQPSGSPADVATRFQQLRDQLDQKAQDDVARLRPAAQDAVAAIGGAGTADSTGYALRQPMANARVAAKEQEDALWRAVDPDGTLAAPMSAITDSAKQVYGNLPKAAEANLSSEERTFRDLAIGYRPVERFAELQSLRSELASALRQELAQNGRTPAYMRMSDLMGAVQRTINGTVEHKAAQEAHGVETGALNAQDTIDARVSALRTKWNIDADAARSNASGSLGRTGTDASGLAGGRAPSGAGAIRAGRAPEGRAGQTPGNSGVPQEALLEPSFDAAASGRIRAASQTTLNRAQTYDEGVAGDILAPGGRSGQYRMPDAAVPAAVVPSGKPTDALAVRQFLAAGGTPQSLADATAYSVRANSMRPDGMLDPAKVRAWMTRNRDALAEMPPDVGARFHNVADTQTAVDEMVARHEAERTAFNRSALARVANLQHGEDVVKTVGGVFNSNSSVGQMRTLADAASSDPAAREGLRRAVAEVMMGKLTTNSSVDASGVHQIKGDTYLGFMRKNGPALRQVFSSQELDTMAAIGRDIDRSMRTHQTKGLTSSPGTAQDLGAAKGSILDEITKEIGPAGLAMVSHAAGANVLTSGLGWLGAKTVGRMRATGIQSANELVVKAMLDPALAKRLLAKVPTTPDLGTAQALGDQFVRLSRAVALGDFAQSQTGARRN